MDWLLNINALVKVDCEKVGMKDANEDFKRLFTAFVHSLHDFDDERLSLSGLSFNSARFSSERLDATLKPAKKSRDGTDSLENACFRIFQYDKKRDTWEHKTCIRDLPYSPYRSGSYSVALPDNALVNVKYDRETKNLTMNYPMSYGMISKDVKACIIESPPEHAKPFERTDADFYALYTKDGDEYFAVC